MKEEMIPVRSEGEKPEEPPHAPPEPAPKPDEPDLNVIAPDFDYQTEGADPEQVQER